VTSPLHNTAVLTYQLTSERGSAAGTSLPARSPSYKQYTEQPSLPMKIAVSPPAVVILAPPGKMMKPLLVNVSAPWNSTARRLHCCSRGR